MILDNIEYSYLVQDSHIDREKLDEIIDLIVDTVYSVRKVIRITGDDYPVEVVKSRFMKLDSSHVQYVMDCMKDNTTNVRNIKKYLLAVLYNAPNHHQQLLFFSGAARYVRMIIECKFILVPISEYIVPYFNIFVPLLRYSFFTFSFCSVIISLEVRQ